MELYRKGQDPRPTPTPVALTSTVAYYYFAHPMAAFAEMLHKNGDAQYFNKLAVNIKLSYNKHFLNEQTGQYAQGRTIDVSSF